MNNKINIILNNIKNQIQPERKDYLRCDFENQIINTAAFKNRILVLRIIDDQKNIYMIFKANFRISLVTIMDIEVIDNMLMDAIFQEFQRWASFGKDDFDNGHFSLQTAYNCAKALYINKYKI